MPRRGCRVAVVVALSLLAASAVRSLSAHRLQPAAQDRPPSRLTLDLVALDRDGRFVDTLRPEDIFLTVDGQPRRVIGMRHVSRGPGAFALASRRATSGGPVAAAVEDSRTVLVIIDEVMLDPANLRTVRDAAGAFIDRLGPNDRAAVLHIPQPETNLTFSTERPALREALRAAGTGEPASLAQAQADPRIPAGDLERMSMTLGGLQRVFGRLGEVPGRKTVAFFSAGLPSPWFAIASQMGMPQNATITGVVQRAAASRVAVYGFGIYQSPPKGPRPDLSPVETIARDTGGEYTTIDVLGKSMDRLASALSACYVIELEGDADPGSPPSNVEVRTSRQGVTLESPAWLVAGSVPDDRPLAAPLPGSSAAGERRAADLPRDPDLRLLLARLGEYVDAYQQQFSAIVAEESYEQVSMGRRVHLRSDLLLLPPAAGQDWVQFRDVYEVDGQKVRDREDRLKKLFLENNPEGRLRLEAIRKESARYNLGEVQRNQNVPLYPLTFVTTANMACFTFKIARRGLAGGIATARVEYVERARPTFVRNLRYEDVPVRGSFTVDSATGAVLESEMIAEDSSMRGRVVVRYRRDDTQGLWLPSEMYESYEVHLRAASGNLTAPVLRTEGRATYSNFRRFRISTDTQFKEKK